MILSEIKIPPKLQEMLTEFRASRYYKGTRETLKREKLRKNYDQLHMQYEYALLNNPLGKIWMHLYSDPEYAMEQILNIPPNPPYDTLDRIDFLCNLCLLMDLESQNATADGKLTTKTFPRQALLDYVGRIKPFVTPQWADKVDDMWNDLLDEQQVIDFIKPTRKNDIFNHYAVHRIVAFIANRGVYDAHNTQLSKTLEGCDNNYRTRMGDGVEDIEDIIKANVPIK